MAGFPDSTRHQRIGEARCNVLGSQARLLAQRAAMTPQSVILPLMLHRLGFKSNNFDIGPAVPQANGR
jgi:hypothetical protein